MCTQPVFENVLDMDPITALSPQTWFEHVGDAIAERAGCGSLLENDKIQPHKPSETRRRVAKV